MPQAATMLEVDGLSVAYGGIQAVRGLSLSVAEGEAVALLGSNGAGKSSALNALMGLAPKAAGRIFLDRVDITSTATEDIVRMGVALVPEGRHVFERMTVSENLVLGGTTRRIRPGAAGLDLAALLELFPILRDRRRQLAGTLSGGEQQQLAIARALMSNPRVLLLDEPSLGLAPQITQRIFELIGKLRSYGLTMVIVEQNAELALQFTDRTYLLAAGLLQLSGSSDEIRARKELQELYLGVSAA